MQCLSKEELLQGLMDLLHRMVQQLAHSCLPHSLLRIGKYCPSEVVVAPPVSDGMF